MDTTIPATASKPSPGRRRRSWLKRIAMVFLVLLLAVVVSHAVWGWRAKAAFERRLTELDVAGEQIRASAFAAAPMAPDQNAALDLMAAGELIDPKDPQWLAVNDIERSLPLDEKEMSAIQAVLSSKQQALGLIETAAHKPGVDWGIDPNVPYLFVKIPGLTEARALANLLSLAALAAHQRGEESLAFQSLHAMLFLSRAVDRQATIVSHLVAVGISTLAARMAEQIAPDLRVGVNRQSSADAHKLIADFVDDRDLHDGLAAAMRRERLMTSQAIVSIATGQMAIDRVSGTKPPTFGQRVSLYVMKPILYDDGRFAVDHLSGVVRAADKCLDFPSFRATAPPLPEREMDQRRWRHMLSSILLPSQTRLARAHFCGIADRRLAAVALAIGSYAAHHAGKRPASLDELLTEYLPAIPADPFAAAGVKLRYKPSEDRPILYSAGEDGTDDGGSEQPGRQYRYKGAPPQRWDCLDGVLHLKRQPRMKPAEADPSEAR
jgi:hypothetical protein